MRLRFSVAVNAGWLAWFGWVFLRYPLLSHEEVNHAHAFLFLEAFALTLLPLALACLFGLRAQVRARSGWGVAGTLLLFLAVVGTAVFFSRDLSLWRGGGWLAGAVAVLLGTRLVELLWAARRPLRAAARFLVLCGFPVFLVNVTLPFFEFAFIGPESSIHLMLIQGGVVYYIAVILYRLSEHRGRRWINPFHPRGRTRRRFAAALVVLVAVVAVRSDAYRLSDAEQEARRESRAEPSRGEYIRQEFTVALTILCAIAGTCCFGRACELEARRRKEAPEPEGAGDGEARPRERYSSAYASMPSHEQTRLRSP